MSVSKHQAQLCNCEPISPLSGRINWALRAAVVFLSALIGAATLAVPTAYAATTTISVLLDTDNNVATGCTIATVNGPFTGVERVLATKVVTNTAGYRIDSITAQTCAGGALGAPIVIDAVSLPIARGNGINGSSAVETYIPSRFLPNDGKKIRIGVTTLGSDGLIGGDALTLTSAGDAILVDGTVPIVVPTLAAASLVLTGLLLAGSLWLARRRGWNGAQLTIVAVFALSLSGQLIAAYIVRDGFTGDWVGILPAASDPVGDGPAGGDLVAVYSTPTDDALNFRFDIILNAPPAATAQSVIAIVGQSQPIILAGTDYEQSPLTFSVVTPPTQGVLTGTAPNLTYTPNLSATDSDSFTFKTNDGTLDSDTVTASITVTRAPAITSAASTTFGVGDAGNFIFTASGSPMPTFALTACGPALPDAITAVGSLLSGAPLAGDIGVYSCTLTAMNSAGSATQAFALTITQIPVAVDDVGSVLAGGTLTLAAPGLLGNDQLSVPKATLTFFGDGSLGGAVIDNAAGASTTLGTGALQVNANGGLTFTPDAGFIGPFSFSYRIENSQGTSDAIITIDVNRAPLFTGASTGTLQVGTAGNIAFSASGWPAPAVNTAACAPALPASVTAASTTVGTSGTITFSGTPNAGEVGTYSCPLTASNTIAPAATQNVIITIANAPTFANANSADFVVGTAKTFNIVTTGIPAPTLTNPGGCALPAGLTLSLGAATVSGTATATGTASCNLVATNVSGTANQTLTINVLQAPNFTAFGPYNLLAGNSASFSATATGVPLPVITQTVGSLPAGITVASNPAGTIDFSGTPIATGTFPVTLSATNTVSTVSQAASINVTCPTITVTPSTVSNPVVGASFSQAFTASGMNSSTFVWTATGLPASGLSISPMTGVVSGTPTAAGPISFTVTATGAASCAGNTGVINTSVNEAPAFISADNATFTVGTLGTFTAAASGSPAPSVTGSCVGLPNGVTLVGATLSGTAAANTGGSYAGVCTFNASNGVGSAIPQTFSLTVNEAVAITSSASAAFALNQPGSFTVTTSGFPVVNDITLMAIPAGSGACVPPNGLAYSYSSGTTATISGTSTASTPVTCLVTASNGVSAPATQTLTIVADTAPIAVGDTLQTLQNITLSTSITTNDSPGVPPPTLTFGGGSLAGDASTNVAGAAVSLAGGVNNFTIDAAGLLTLTTPTTVGTYTVNYRLTNVAGSSNGAVTLNVGTLPTLTDAPTNTATVGTPYSYTFTTVTGSPTPTIGAATGSLPPPLTFGANNITGTPTTPGVYPLTVRATNLFGSSTPTVTPSGGSITVSCPALTVNPVTVANPVINTAFSPTVSFTAAGLAGTYTWAATGVPSGMAVSGAGVFSGTPTVSGLQSMIVTGAHTSGCQATRAIAFTITVPPPVVTTSVGTTTFTEGGAAVIVDGAVTTSSAGSATLASATVSITGGFQSGLDVLGFVAVPATMGNITGGYAAPILSLTSAGATATLAQWRVALRAVTYSNTSQNPNTANRTISFLINDGNSNSAITTKTLAVIAVNNPPLLANGSTITYTEKAVAAVINTAITVTDADSINLTGATVSITANFNAAQDVLSYATALGVTGTYTSTTGVLALSGTTTVANYQTALRNVKYNNTSANPTLGARTVTFVATDGIGASNIISSTVNIMAVNDAPSAIAKSYSAQTNMKISVAAASGLLVGATDPDGLATSLTVGTVGASSPVGSTLTVNNATGAFDFDPAPGVTGNVTFTYTVCDNGVPLPIMCSAAATVTINVAGSVIWFVDSAAAAGGKGTLASPFNTLAAADAVDAANHRIFLYTGTYATGIVLNNGEWLIGQGASVSFDSIFGTPPAGTIPRPVTNGTRPTVQGTVTLNTNSTVRGLNLSTGAATGLTDPAAAITGVNLSELSATSTTGTAVNLSDIVGTISLTSVSATGAASGILLTNTSGSFAVTGTGTANTGGTIQNATGHGIALVNAQNVSLARMNIQSTAKSGINGTGVTNFAFTNGTINNSGTAAVVGTDYYSNIAFNNNAALISSLAGNNINGTLTVTGSTLTNAYYSGLSVFNSNGTIADAVITGNTITSSTNVATSKGYGIELVGTGDASTTGNLTKATITTNTIRNFPSGGGMQLLYGNVSTTGPGGRAGTAGSATDKVVITGNDIAGQSAANRMNTGAIQFIVSGGNTASRSQGNADISNNPNLANTGGSTLGIGNNGFATMTATVNNNVIVANNIFGSQGIGGGNGVVNGCAIAGSCETPDLTMTVTNNNVSQTDGNGILLVSRGNLGLAKLSVKSNVVAAPLGGVRPGIRIDAGNNTANSDDVVCLRISGNTSAGSGTNGLGIRKQGTVVTTHDFGIVGLAAGTSSGATATALVTTNNPLGNGTLLISGDNFINCNTAPP